jgi:hypothetical protein
MRLKIQASEIAAALSFYRTTDLAASTVWLNSSGKAVEIRVARADSSCLTPTSP